MVSTFTHSRAVRLQSHAAAVAIAALLLCATAPQAGASIVTNQYSTSVGSISGTPDPDGAFYANGTPALVSISFDSALTYIGAPDSVIQTHVTIPAGLKVTVGSDIFTADDYYITFYNAGAFRSSADVDFRTLGFNVLRNGLPFAAAEPGYLQFTFYGLANFTPAAIAPGLSFPLPPYFGEGVVRENQSNSGHEYYFDQGSWVQVPSPAGACVLGLAGLAALRRRR